MGFCNVYLRDAVDILSEDHVQHRSRSFVLVGLGSVQRFPEVKERERVQPTIFEEVLEVHRICHYVIWTGLTSFHRKLLYHI